MVWTVLALIAVVAIVLLVDLFVLMRNGWTISRTMRELGKYPWVVFLIGFIVGATFAHFWWQIH